MKYIVDSVNQYLSLPQTNYALQIDGAWGTGKTFFIKNQIKEAVEKQNARNGENFKFCYISLNGFSKVEEIGESVFLEIANNNNQVMMQGLKFLGKYGVGITAMLTNSGQAVTDFTEDIKRKMMESSHGNMENVVICFDDLERIDDSLSIKQVFGYINSNYIEHNHIKVIFVSNDEEIIDKENYKVVREKIIGKTLNFVQSEVIVLGDMIENIYSEESQFIEFFRIEKAQLLKSLHLVFNEVNLRTLRFVLDSFVVLQSKAWSLFQDEEERMEMSRTLFLNTLIVGNEYKKGNLTTVKDLSPFYGMNYFYLSSNDNVYLIEFLKKYHNVEMFIDKNIHYFPSISHYIIQGYLKEPEFEEEISSYMESRRSAKNEKNREWTSLDVLHDFRMFDEKVVKSAQEEVLEKVKNGSFSAEEFPSLYNQFSVFLNEELILSDEKDVEKILSAGFEKALEKWQPSSQTRLRHYIHTGTNPIVKSIIEALQNKVSVADYEVRKRKVSVWIQTLTDDTLDYGNYNDIESEKDFFKIVLEHGLFDDIAKLSNKFVVLFTQFLSHKYLRISNSYEFQSHEVPYIERTIEKVTKYIEESQIEKIKSFNINLMLEQLNKVKGHVEKR